MTDAEELARRLEDQKRYISKLQDRNRKLATFVREVSKGIKPEYMDANSWGWVKGHIDQARALLDGYQ